MQEIEEKINLDNREIKHKGSDIDERKLVSK